MAKKYKAPRKAKGVIDEKLYEQYLNKYTKASAKLTKKSKGTANMFKQAVKYEEGEDNQFRLEYIRARNDLIQELREQGKSTVGVNSQVIIRRMVRQATTPVSEAQALRQATFFKEQGWKVPVKIPVQQYDFKEDTTEDINIMISVAKQEGIETLSLERTPTAEDILFGRVDIKNLKPMSRDDKRLSNLYHELINEGFTRAKAGEYISYYVYGSD